MIDFEVLDIFASEIGRYDEFHSSGVYRGASQLPQRWARDLVLRDVGQEEPEEWEDDRIYRGF